MPSPSLQAIREKAPEVQRLAATRHVVDVRIFGSVARGDDGPGSDVDLLVEGDGEFSLIDMAGLRDDLSRLLGRGVDVVTLGALRPAQRERILREAVRL